MIEFFVSCFGGLLDSDKALASMTMESSKQWVYRILSFDRLVQMVRTNNWYFARPSQWEDPHERRFRSPLDGQLFAQCWCRKGVSDAMWRIYSPDKLGVRIRVSVKKLSDALRTASIDQDFSFRVRQVKYLNQIEELVPASGAVIEMADRDRSFNAASEYLFNKRRAFSHEVETRVVLHQRLGANNGMGLMVNLRTSELVESVLVDPRAPNEFVDAYASLLRNEFNTTLRVQKSRLYEESRIWEP